MIDIALAIVALGLIAASLWGDYMDYHNDWGIVAFLVIIVLLFRSQC